MIKLSKKFLTVFMACLCLGTAFSGCGKSADAADSSVSQDSEADSEKTIDPLEFTTEDSFDGKETKTFTSKNNKVTFQYPSSWQDFGNNDTNAESLSEMFFLGTEKRDAIVTAIVTTIAPGLEADFNAYCEKTKENFQKKCSEKKGSEDINFKERIIKVKGNDAVLYSAESQDNDKPYQNSTLVVNLKDTFVVLDFTCTQECYNENEPLFNALINSMLFN